MTEKGASFELKAGGETLEQVALRSWKVAPSLEVFRVRLDEALSSLI